MSDDVRSEFEKYGEITEFVWNNKKCKAIITYKKDFMAREAIEKTTLRNPFVSCKNFSSNWFVTEDQARKDFKDLENTETAYTFQALLMYM